MTEVAAAMGLTSLESMTEFVEVNRRNHRRYREELSGVPGLTLVEYDESEAGNFQYVVLEVDEFRAGLSRDALKDVLWAENVLARRYFHPGCHRMEPYRSYFPNAGLLLPQTERLTEQVLALPTGTAVEPEEIARVCEIIRLALAHGPELKERLQEAGVPAGIGRP
jgi:dTDP-4-amino-4,6-dideoxygalactose transaminase